MRGTALVTGGGKRIGKALSMALAGAGFDIAVHGHSLSADTNATLDAIRALGRRAAFLAADLSHEAEVATLVPRACEALGPLTLLINSASHFTDDRLGTATRESWDAHFEPNLRAPIVLAQAFAAQVRDEASDPSIINLIDQRVLKPNPQFFSYTLTKVALFAATKTMAQALAPRIRVNGIGPGPTLASVHQTEQTFAAEVAGTLLQRPSAPEEIARAALYLVDARTVTGQMIAVDAGQHLTWRTPDILHD